MGRRTPRRSLPGSARSITRWRRWHEEERNSPVTSLDLAVIGNCAFNALVDKSGIITWCCLPRPDGDPVFNRLINEGPDGPPPADGFFAIQLLDFEQSEQSYVPNTAVLKTRLVDRQGNAVEITDFAP